MPELPEVETVVRSIRPHVIAKRILAVELYSHRVTRQDHASAAAGLTGAEVENVGRNGKQILIHLDRGTLFVHLGMTGKLRWQAQGELVSGLKHIRACLHFQDGTLFYDDPRMFGRFEFFEGGMAGIAATGPDALAIPRDTFISRLQGYRGRVKAVLLNQKFLGGVGNIYADEALFFSRIHPNARANRLSRERSARLHEAIGEVLHSAIRHRGSSISDYVDGSGEEGTFQTLHNAYGRTGLPCPRCGTPIRRTLVAQRGTHYCPRCQRA